MDKSITASTGQPDPIILNGIRMASLTESIIAKYSALMDEEGLRGKYIIAEQLSLNRGVFTGKFGTLPTPIITVLQDGEKITLTCTCPYNEAKLCEHQSQVLYGIIRQEDLLIFFDEKRRSERLRKLAADYGLEYEQDLDQFFEISYLENKLIITPRLASLLPVTNDSLNSITNLLLPVAKDSSSNQKIVAEGITWCIIIKKHKSYRNIVIALYHSPTTKEGKPKNPLILMDSLPLIWETEDVQSIRFFTTISKFQNNISTQITETAITGLKAVVKNPLNLPVYYHNSEASENVIASALTAVNLGNITSNIALTVRQKGAFYEISGKLEVDGTAIELKDIQLAFTCFIQAGNTLYLVKNLQSLNIINFFKKKPGSLLIHSSKYGAFKNGLLEKLEANTSISYTYIRPATPSQMERYGFYAEKEKIIYLSDSGNYVSIIPVMKYGDIEIPIRSKKGVYATDEKGVEFAVQRDTQLEDAFTAMLTRQHPDFREQLEDVLPEFYLHKDRFLNEDWFLNAFEDWRTAGISIYGFNEISGNKLNSYKAKITVQVTSGINWFNAEIKARFGKKKASLKQIHKAIVNKSKFVTLDDGTQGILPVAWIEKLSGFFDVCEIYDIENLRTPKINYAAVASLYDAEMLSNEVQEELTIYQDKLAGFESIKAVETPATLLATLRPYQQQGLAWLNFLDDFNFGGILADDMGLGKTVQILAFILSQREKVARNTNLLVVPTSLLFNWQAEVNKFAPGIAMLTLHGAERDSNIQRFGDYEIVMTSYGTLLSDIQLLKAYPFNYIFLDESQNIKNPDSQRYKAVRLLQSRNKIAITGTPIENNTFDLYGQLSFACPGLLGSKQFFKDTYSTPIDTFKVSKRAKELQEKVKPFILRRTKQQVATELPEKTEVVLHCEMGPAQRNIYNAYEKEFREYISATTNEELPKNAMNVLRGLTRLRQICNSPLLLKEEKIKESASTKIAVLMEQIENKSSQHKILVFSQFVSMLELIRVELEQRMIGYALLTGSTQNRSAVVDSFENNPGIRVFLISLKAGGTGLNLTAADYVYIVDPWWNPAVENQAIDRVYRIGQQKHVVAVRLICPDTVEEKILQLQETKKGLAEGLVGGAVVQTLDKEELLGLLGDY